MRANQDVGFSGQPLVFWMASPTYVQDARRRWSQKELGSVSSAWSLVGTPGAVFVGVCRYKASCQASWLSLGMAHLHRRPFGLAWLENRGPWFSWWFNHLPGPSIFQIDDSYGRLKLTSSVRAPLLPVSSSCFSFSPSSPWPEKHIFPQSFVALFQLLRKCSLSTSNGCGSKPMVPVGLGAPPILVQSRGDWDVHQGYRVLTHSQTTNTGALLSHGH